MFSWELFTVALEWCLGLSKKRLKLVRSEKEFETRMKNITIFYRPVTLGMRIVVGGNVYKSQLTKRFAQNSFVLTLGDFVGWIYDFVARFPLWECKTVLGSWKKSWCSWLVQLKLKGEYRGWKIKSNVFAHLLVKEDTKRNMSPLKSGQNIAIAMRYLFSPDPLAW